MLNKCENKGNYFCVKSFLYKFAYLKPDKIQ